MHIIKESSANDGEHTENNEQCKSANNPLTMAFPLVL